MTAGPASQPTRQFVEVAIAIVFNGGGQLLICKRKPDAVLAGYWEFPGGKCNAGESPADCARREVREETGLTVAVKKPLDLIDHEYPHARVRLHPFICTLVAGELQLLEVVEAKWIAPATAGDYQFPEANASLIAQIATGRGL